MCDDANHIRRERLNGTSRNMLLIILAIRLQRLVKNLPNHHRSPERITRRSLAESYLAAEIVDSEEAARRRAARYLAEMERIFGLEGDEKAGFAMARRFERFRDMFAHWLNEISPPSPHDRRLHVMLSGLIQAIDNGFSDDPIVVPELARQLQERYGYRNRCDAEDPMWELFDNTYIASALQLVEADDNALSINRDSDPLLLRLRSRQEVGGNEDISINLALPGRIRLVMEDVIADLGEDQRNRCRAIAEAVRDGMVWQMDGHEMLPFILYREGRDGEVLLTLRNLDEHCFEERTLETMGDVPPATRRFVPLGLDERVWALFQEMHD